MAAESNIAHERNQQTPREFKIAEYKESILRQFSIPSLARAILDGQSLEKITTLLDEDPNVEEDVTGPRGRQITPLMCAVLWGSDDLVALFLDRGADISRAIALEADWPTPLACAVISGSEKTVRLLLERGAPVNQLRGVALYWASVYGDIPLMQLLHAHGADCSLVNFADVMENSQIHALDLLLEWGASAKEAFDVALYRTNVHTIQYLINTRRAELAPLFDKALYQCAVDFLTSGQYEEVVAILLLAGAQPDGYKNEEGNTALACLAHDEWEVSDFYSEFHIRIVEQLLAAGADPRAKFRDPYVKNEDYYCTAFEIACTYGHRELIQPLADSDFSLVMSAGQYLLEAAKNGDPERVKALCAVGMDLEATDKNGRTTLYQGEENAEITRTLLANGARWDVACYGKSPLDQVLASAVFSSMALNGKNKLAHVFFLVLYGARINNMAALQQFLDRSRQQKDPKEVAQIAFCWGALYEARGDLDAAKASYESALTQFSEVHYRLARIYEKEKNFQKAGEHFAALAQQSDECKTVYYRLAETYEQEGDLVRAKQFYLKTTENKAFPRLANLAFHRLLVIAKRQGDLISPNEYYAELIKRKDHAMLFHATRTLKVRCVESTSLKAPGEKVEAVTLSHLEQTKILYEFIQAGQSFDKVFSFEDWQFIVLDAISNPSFDHDREAAYVLAFYAVQKARGRATTPVERESIEETLAGIKSVLTRKIEAEYPRLLPSAQDIAGEIAKFEAKAQQLGKPLKVTTTNALEEKAEDKDDDSSYAEALVRQLEQQQAVPSTAASSVASSTSVPVISESTSEAMGLDEGLDFDDGKPLAYGVRREVGVADSLVPASSQNPTILIPPNLPRDMPGINFFATPSTNQVPDATVEKGSVFVECAPFKEKKG